MFNIHHLAVDDAQSSGSGPRWRTTTTSPTWWCTAPPATTDDGPTDEVHFIFAEHFVITIHQGPCPAMDECTQADRHRRASRLESPQVAIIYLVIDQLVDSFFPMLDRFDGQIDELEDAILVEPTDEQLGTLFTMKRSLITIRKVVTPQRDMFASITSGVAELPGMTDDGQRYMRDIYDHLIRISDLVDGYRDLLSSVDGHPPLHRVQPAQRGDEAADHHRHGVPAAELPHRVLRSELPVPGPEHRRRRPLWVFGVGLRGGRGSP